jgi:uncharacterized protein (DUF1778 family)
MSAKSGSENLDQVLFTASAKQLKAFLALIDAPLDNSALQRLLAKRAPWEK